MKCTNMHYTFRVNKATTKLLPHLGDSSIDTCLHGCNFQYDVRIGRTITRIRKLGYIMTSALVLKEKEKKQNYRQSYKTMNFPKICLEFCVNTDVISTMWDHHTRREWPCFLELLKRTLQDNDTKILFCGHGLNFSP